MKQIDIQKLTETYDARLLGEEDADDILRIMHGNPIFYEYTTAKAERDAVIEDMKALPPGKMAADKYYFGFFDHGQLIAVMDLIDGYPDEETAFIGFFMMAAEKQGRGAGSHLVQDVLKELKRLGFAKARLCINKGNPQSSHFWYKNGFVPLKETARGVETVILAERKL